MKQFETSLIMRVPLEIGALVESLRAIPILPAEATTLPGPHVTLLFIGFPDAAMVERLKPALAAEPEPQIDVELNGWGAFRRGDGTSNVHIRVRPNPELLALHKWAVEACRLCSLTPPKETSGDNYRPHITVADGRLDPDLVLRHLAEIAIPSKIVLNQLLFRAHPWKP